MIVDTGAAILIIRKKTIQKLFPETQLNKSDAVLKTYTAKCVKVAGEFKVNIEYQIQSHMLVLVIGSGIFRVSSMNIVFSQNYQYYQELLLMTVDKILL